MYYIDGCVRRRGIWDVDGCVRHCDIGVLAHSSKAGWHNACPCAAGVCWRLMLQVRKHEGVGQLWVCGWALRLHAHLYFALTCVCVTLSTCVHCTLFPLVCLIVMVSAHGAERWFLCKPPSACQCVVHGCNRASFREQGAKPFEQSEGSSTVIDRTATVV